MTEIKRSVHSTLNVSCRNADYAEGVKDGVIYTLSNLLHECDVVIRVMPYVEHYESDENYDYRVRARFSVREKRQGTERGRWIKDFSAYYEEPIHKEPYEEEVGITTGGVAVTVSTSGTTFKVEPAKIFKKWIDNPLLTDNGQTVGQRQRAWLHEKLDSFIDSKLEKADNGN